MGISPGDIPKSAYCNMRRYNEARKRERRLLLVRERAAIRRVDTYPYN